MYIIQSNRVDITGYNISKYYVLKISSGNALIHSITTYTLYYIICLQDVPHNMVMYQCHHRIIIIGIPWRIIPPTRIQ